MPDLPDEKLTPFLSGPIKLNCIMQISDTDPDQAFRMCVFVKYVIVDQDG